MKPLRTKLMVTVLAAWALSLALAGCSSAAPAGSAAAKSDSATSKSDTSAPAKQSGETQTGAALASKAVFYFSGIPDQDTSRWAQRYKTMSDYLTRKLGVEVKGVPSVDYAAVVTGFSRGDIHLGFFGGLTGVQARLAAPDSEAIAQRPED
ncbi:MAG: phosphonate transporter periplasmic phosphonate-binding protein, partial [Dehalococcoidia bacterium]|nr:phosphonate transporter periplasmic phosphonate-binding protein [Dehalococcoidia bacterium]